MSKAIIDAAHKHGLPAAAHIFYLEDAKQLAGAGVNGFAHSVRDKPVDQALIDSMKKHGTWLAAADGGIWLYDPKTGIQRVAQLPLPPKPSPVSDFGMPGITPVVAGPCL